jgi:hypothetical protein
VRVAVAHQGFIPHYRVRFFELLNQRSDSEYVIFHGAPPTGSGHCQADGPFGFPNVFVHNRELGTRAGKSLIYEPILRKVLEGASMNCIPPSE